MSKMAEQVRKELPDSPDWVDRALDEMARRVFERTRELAWCGEFPTLEEVLNDDY